MTHWNRVIAIGLIGAAIGFILSSLLGPNAASVPQTVQVALVGLLGGVFGALGGAAIGAYAATQVANRAREDARLAREEASRAANRATEINREEATFDRRQRVEEATMAREVQERLAREAETLPRRLELFAELVTLAERHEKEVKQQAARRAEVATGDGLPESIPSVGSTERMSDITGQLYFLADEQTADRGWKLYAAVVDLDMHVYNANRHLRDGVVIGLSDEEYDALRDQTQKCGRERLRFTQEARRELGKAPLEGPVSTLLDSYDEDDARLE